ncbi:nitrogen fixation protein NifQ [Azotobacter vinelandii]
MRRDEWEELRVLLLDGRRGDDPEELWMASIVAAACLGGDHLWRDLGLESRETLRVLLMHNFPPPCRAQREKKHALEEVFFYKQLCEQDGGYVCRSPSCEQCPSHHDCFGAEI